MGKKAQDRERFIASPEHNPAKYHNLELRLTCSLKLVEKAIF
jgi:hypothetical protein